MRKPVRPGRRGFTEHSPDEFASTLGQKLIRTVDTLRDLQTRFGMRPYVVRLIRVRWTGGARGVGEPVTVRSEVILPTPRVLDVGSMRDVMEMIGRTETGDIRITEISGRYSEGFLRNVDADGDPLGENESAFWEVDFPGQNRGGTAERRFYELSSVPVYESDRFQWTLMLTQVTALSDELGEVT